LQKSFGTISQLKALLQNRDYMLNIDYEEEWLRIVHAAQTTSHITTGLTYVKNICWFKYFVELCTCYEISKDIINITIAQFEILV
jgi:hypothetical protein